MTKTISDRLWDLAECDFTAQMAGEAHWSSTDREVLRRAALMLNEAATSLGELFGELMVHEVILARMSRDDAPLTRAAHIQNRIRARAG